MHFAVIVDQNGRLILMFTCEREESNESDLFCQFVKIENII